MVTLRSWARRRLAARPLWWLAMMLCWITALCLPASAHSQSTGGNLLLASAYWVDEAGNADLEQARTQAYTPYVGVLNRGYTDAVHWVRLSLPSSTSPLGLRMFPVWLDELTLYDPTVSTPVRTMGDRVPADLNSHDGLGFSAVLPASAQPRDVWLRLRSTSAHRLDVQVLPADQLPAANARTLVWVSAYGMALLLVLLLLMFMWVTQPDRVLATFLLRHLSFAYFAMGYLGLPNLLLAGVVPPAALDMAFSLSVVLTLPVALRFDVALLSTFNPDRRLLALMRAFFWLGVGLLLLVLVGQQRLALQLNVQAMTVGVTLLFLTAWSCKPAPSVHQLLSKKVLMTYYTLLLTGIFLGLISLQGWFKFSDWQPQILLFQGLVSALFMTIILFVRGQRQLDQTRQMTWRLHEAEKTVEREQLRRREQSQFLHMLMHELKTPLSIISMALGVRDNKAQNLQLAGQAVQDMKAIIDRCVDADRVGYGVPDHGLEWVDVGYELRQLTQNLNAQQPLQVFELQADVRVQTDRQFLRTILTNLLSNACRYGDPVSPVEIRLHATQSPRQGVCVQVDNMPGLAGWPEPEKLFTKYYRASGAQRDSGSGLGLYLARQLANTLGGDLTYQSTERSVRFELWLPQTSR